MAKKDLYDASHLDTRHHIMFFTRHDLERVVVVYPKGHKDKPEGGSETGIEQIRKWLAAKAEGKSHGLIWMRRDICMINVEGGRNPEKQFVLDPYREDEKMKKQPIWKMLRKDQQAECIRLRDLCIEAEVRYGLPERTLTF